MNLSRKLLVAEAIVFALPLTFLLGRFAPTISIPRKGEFWPFGAADLITVIAMVAVSAGWVLIVKALRGSLRQSHHAWWYAASLGVALVVAAIVSMLLPASREYSPAAIFRDHLQHCILGLPLGILLAHLWIEARSGADTQAG